MSIVIKTRERSQKSIPTHFILLSFAQGVTLGYMELMARAQNIEIIGNLMIVLFMPNSIVHSRTSKVFLTWKMVFVR